MPPTSRRISIFPHYALLVGPLVVDFAELAASFCRSRGAPSATVRWVRLSLSRSRGVDIQRHPSSRPAARRYNQALLKSLTDGLIAFGPVGVLLIVFLDSLGVPLPTVLDIWLVTVAIENPQRAYITAAMAVIASLAGNYALFHAARYGSRFIKAETPNSKREKFRHWFTRYGLLTVFVPAVVPFIPLPLKVFVISAGAMRTSTSRFLAVVLLARFLRYFGEAYLGIRLGRDALGFLTNNAGKMAGAVLAVALIFVALVKWYDRRRAEA